MPLCGVHGFTGSLCSAYLCPVCEGRPPDPLGGGGRMRIETLRIHLNVHNEVVVRTGLPWSEIPELLEKHRVFGHEKVPAGWIDRAEDWERFDKMFEKAKALFRRLAQGGQIEDICFGEVGVSSAFELERTLPGVKLVSRWGKSAMFFIELHRSLLGLPTLAGMGALPRLERRAARVHRSRYV